MSSQTARDRRNKEKQKIYTSNQEKARLNDRRENTHQGLHLVKQTWLLARYPRYSTRQGALVRSHGVHFVPSSLYSTWEKRFRSMGHVFIAGRTRGWETPCPIKSTIPDIDIRPDRHPIGIRLSLFHDPRIVDRTTSNVPFFLFSIFFLRFFLLLMD